MTNFPLDKNLNKELKKLTENDPVHADTFNPLFEQLINNDAKLDSTVSSFTSQLAETTEEVRVTQSNPVNFSGAIVTIIDDDARPNFRTVWQPILDANPDVKIGIAVVKDWTEDGSALSISELTILQNDGHDILPHTAQHEASYLITPERAELDYPVSKQFMKDNGFKAYEHLVYPGGLNPNAIDIKNVARKHFKYAISTQTAGDYATTPIDNWCIPRIDGDGKTLDQLKAAVDYAKANGIWLVLMTHSHILLDAGKQKMIEFIAYVKSQNVPILPYTEAVKYKGNAVALGEFTKQGSTFISVDGGTRQGTIFVSENINMNSPLTSYKSNFVSKIPLSYLQDTFTNKGGVMEVFRGKDDGYGYATFIPINKNRMFMRKWNNTTKAWSDWELASNFEIRPLVVGGIMDDVISTYPKNSVTTIRLDYIKDTFKSVGGILTTYRMDEDSTAYQTYKQTNANKLYIRRWSSTVWGGWEIVGGHDVSAVKNNGAILLEPITAFMPNTVAIYPCETNANAPESKGGIYQVYNFTDTSYAYAEYKIWNSNVQYRRRWSAGAWTAWEIT